MILFDLPVYQFIMSIFPVSMSMTVIMKMITTLGSSIVIVAGLISVAVLIRDKKYFKIFVFANLLAIILNNIIKLIVHRPRPSNTMTLAVETSYSFPSGHSMMSMVFYGFSVNIIAPRVDYFFVFLYGIYGVYLWYFMDQRNFSYSAVLCGFLCFSMEFYGIFLFFPLFCGLSAFYRISGLCIYRFIRFSKMT